MRLDLVQNKPDLVLKRQEPSEACQAPMLGGGDFSVPAGKKKNTTARGLTKNPKAKSKRGTSRPQVGMSP
jgi:hypothetical protein